MELHGREGVSTELMNALLLYAQSVNDLQEKKQQKTEAADERKDIYQNTEGVREAFEKKEKLFLEAMDDLQKAKKAYYQVQDDYDNGDQRAAELSLQRARKRVQDVTEDYERANKALERTQSCLSIVEGQLKSAEDLLDTASNHTQWCKDKFKERRLAVDRILGFADGFVPPIVPDAQSHLSDVDNLVSSEQSSDSSPNTHVGKRNILHKSGHGLNRMGSQAKILAQECGSYFAGKGKKVFGRPQVQT